MIEKLVTGLEISKKLKELGVLQKSCYYWSKNIDSWVLVNIDEKLNNVFLIDHSEAFISAFTCTELAAMIGEIKTIFWTYPLSPDAMGKTIIDLLSIYSVNDTNTNIKKFWEKK